MKRLPMVAIAALACFAAACGGSSPTPAPPPPVGAFSSASLKGTYAFTMSGQSPILGGLIQRAGSFIADGNGNITSGIEDLTDLDSAAPVTSVAFTSGTYAVQGNGKGTLTLTNAGGSLGLSISLKSSSAGFMIENDVNATASGSFALQSPGSFSATGISNNYAFDVSGLAPDGQSPISMIGQLKTNGGGNITAGTADINDGSGILVSGTSALGNAGVYGQDSSNLNSLAMFGRGVMQIAGVPISAGGTATLTFVFYIVDATHFNLMEVDSQAFTAGSAMQQSTIPASASAFTGNFTYLIAGASIAGPIARAASFQADGSGNLASITADDNNNGLISTATGSTLSGTYTIDTTNPNTGRGTLTIKVANQAQPFQASFYMVDAIHGFIQDQSLNVIADGTLITQGSGTVAAGNFAFNWSGTNLAANKNNIPFEEDFVGQYSTSGSATGANGAMDFEELGSLGNNLFLNIPITVTGALNGTGRNTYQVVTGNSPSTTFGFAAYVTSSGEVFLLSEDAAGQTQRVTTGVVAPQP